jgi:hypothetical protein
MMKSPPSAPSMRLHRALKWACPPRRPGTGHRPPGDAADKPAHHPRCRALPDDAARGITGPFRPALVRAALGAGAAASSAPT